MKNTIIRLLAILGLTATSFGGEFGKLNTPYSVIGSNMVASVGGGLTNLAAYNVTNIEYTYRPIYHTIQCYSTTVGSNTVYVSIDRSIDGANWFTVTNNANISTNGIYEYTAVGKWTWHRLRFNLAGTNGTAGYNIMNQ